MTTSALAMSLLIRATPSVRPRSRVTSRLAGLTAWKIHPHSHQRSVDGPLALVKRIPSARWIDSTLMTSAPRATSTWVAEGPAQKAVRSITRTPSRPPRAAPGGSRRPDRPVDGAVVLTEAGRGPEGLRVDTADAVRDTGLGERPVGAVNEHAALEEVVVGQHRLAIADRGDGNPPQGGLLDALLRGPLGRPLVDDSDDLVEAPGPAGGGGHHRVVEQIGPFDQDEKVPKLLSRRGGEADEPVRGGGDRRHLDPAAGTGRGLAPEAGMQPGKRVQGDGHALEERYIKVAAPSRSPGGPHAGQGGDRGVDTADPLAEAATGGQRRTVRPSPPPDRTGPPLEGELRRRPLRPRPAAAERGDRNNGQRRVGVEKAQPPRRPPAPDPRRPRRPDWPTRAPGDRGGRPRSIAWTH